MKLGAISVAFALVTVSSAAMAQQPLVGIVSISATEANNARYIAGAEAAAKESAGRSPSSMRAGTRIRRTLPFRISPTCARRRSSTWWFPTPRSAVVDAANGRKSRSRPGRGPWRRRRRDQWIGRPNGRSGQ